MTGKCVALIARVGAPRRYNSDWPCPASRGAVQALQGGAGSLLLVVRRSLRHIPGVRSLFAVVLYPLVLALGAVAQPAYAQFNNTTPRADFAGPHDYQVTGGSLRRLPNGDRDNGDDDFNGVKD